MHAVVFKRAEALKEVDVNDRFEFEDMFLPDLVPPRSCRNYREHQAGPGGVHVFVHPAGQGFVAKSYLEFEKHVQNETHFRVMQEGQPTEFTVVLA